MPTWLVYDIWVVLSMWSIIEIGGLYSFIQDPKLHYTNRAMLVTSCWFVLVVFWICYRIWG